MLKKSTFRFTCTKERVLDKGYAHALQTSQQGDSPARRFVAERADNNVVETVGIYVLRRITRKHKSKTYDLEREDAISGCGGTSYFSKMREGQLSSVYRRHHMKARNDAHSRFASPQHPHRPLIESGLAALHGDQLFQRNTASSQREHTRVQQEDDETLVTCVRWCHVSTCLGQWY